jgi:hypothetical protein
MTLWIKPLFGDMFSISISLPITSLHNIYRCIQSHHYSDIKIHQLHLFHNESMDLSQVKEGDVLDIFISEPYAEKWVSEFDKKQEHYLFHNSCITWYDGRWGDPYEDPSILNRTSLTLHIHVRENTLEPEDERKKVFTLSQSFFKERYPPSNDEMGWYSTLEEACHHYRENWNKKHNANSFTELTMEHVIRLWNIYHGTNYHLWEKGLYYDY